MSAQNRSIDDIASEAVRSAIDNYYQSQDFKDKSEAIFSEKIQTLVDDSAKKARNWAALAALLVFGVFTIFAGIEYAEIRTREAEVHIQYSEALQLVEKIRNTVDDLESEVNESSEAITKRLGEIEADTLELEEKILDLSGSIEQFQDAD